MIQILEFIKNPQIITIISALGGGIITRIIEQKFKTKKEQLTEDNLDTGISIRNELRGDLDATHTDLEVARQEANEWREKYWNEVSDRVHEQQKLYHHSEKLHNIPEDTK